MCFFSFQLLLSNMVKTVDKNININAFNNCTIESLLNYDRVESYPRRKALCNKSSKILNLIVIKITKD